MNNDAREFGAQLRAYRQMAGLSQEELAGRTRLSVRTISNLERGRVLAPYRDTVRRIADALELLGETRTDFMAAARRRLAPAPESASAASGSGEAALPGGPGLVPRQLPAAVASFTGRAGELAALNDLLGKDGTQVVVISGVAGIGKSALAAYWAQQVAGRFPDGHLFVNLRGFDPSGRPVPAEDAIRGFMEALGIAPDRQPRSPQALAGLYRSMLADRRMLLVLDNARAAAQVRPLLPGSPSCRVVITSRSQLAGLVAIDAVVPVGLGPLNDDEARMLVEARIGAERVVTAADARAVARLAGNCGGLPLALCIAAARAALRPDLPLARIADGLVAARRDLGAFTVADDPAADVRAAFSLSYETLAPQSRWMFRLLGLHPGPEISAEAAASLAGTPPGQAASLLADLTEFNLLARTGDRLVLHDLLRAYALEQAGQRESAADQDAARRRTLDHYLASARAAMAALEGTPRMPVPAPPPAPGVFPEEFSTRAQALAWFTREYAVLLRLIELAAAAGFDVHAWQLPRTLCSVFAWRARWQDWEHTHRIAADAAARLGDTRAQAITLMNWGASGARRDRSPQTARRLQLAHELFGRLEDDLGQARVLTFLGTAFHTSGHLEQAADYAGRAYRLYANLGDRDGQAGALANLGKYQVGLGQHGTARDVLERSLQMFADLGNRTGQGIATHHLAMALQGLGEYQAAIAGYQAAAELYGHVGVAADRAAVLDDLAGAYLAVGHREQAADAYHEALRILTDLSHADAAVIRAKLAGLSSLAG
jgi:transcriptional regulator with XRE-family HTH domain